MLWDLIRDFFVQHVFGGTASNEETFTTFLGWYGNGSDDYYYLDDLVFPMSADMNGETMYISFSDWLCTTATIITIVIIVVLCGLFIKKMVSTVSHLLGN